MPLPDRELIEKYIRGECSPEEEATVICWFDNNDVNDYQDAHHEKIYKRKVGKGWQRIVNSIEELKRYAPSKKFFGRREVWAAAATLTLLIGISVFMYLAGSFGSYHYEKEYQTSYGEIKRMTLPDGTIVTLNAESTLKIERGFSQKNRMVHLDGEAFFEVMHKTAIPFTVETKALSVTALGTSFDVSAFANEPEINVALKTGKVLVKTISKEKAEIILKPGERVVYQKKNALLNKETFNSKIQLAWQNRIIAFQNAGMQQVVNQLERYFGVNIDINHLPVREWQLTGEYKNQSLEDILQSLSFSYGISYKMEDNKIVLYETR